MNWQVQVDPHSLSMTSLPPTLPLFAGAGALDDVPLADELGDELCDELVDELFDELPPQPAATTVTSANALSILKRHIVILRSRRDPHGPRRYLGKT